MAKTTCPECGAPLAVDVAEGLCPRCLLRQAAGSAGERTEQSDSTASQAAPGVSLRYIGDYQLIEEIARGGMGVVYKAHQVTLNRTVAVKMILAGSLADQEARQRFLIEAEAAANLQHPNIVAIHEVGRHGDQHYFSMDYIDGPDLAQLVAQGPLTPARAAGYLQTIAEAIHFAHQRGTLHRDLKPQNVLIDAQDNPRITDFGLAKQLDAAGGITESGTVMGSPSYMPPEQAIGRLDRLGPASDVYSLGAILYELLTGQPPFVGGTTAAVLHRLTHEEPVMPGKLRAGIPTDLQNICLKCLDKQPERRYPSAQTLADDLGRLLAGEPVLARPASPTHRALS